jgi:signal peptidase I
VDATPWLGKRRLGVVTRDERAKCGRAESLTVAGCCPSLRVMHALGSLLRGFFSLASLLALIAVVLNLFFVDILVIPHNGMAPGLVYGDRVLVWRHASVDMGDAVVCEHPAKAGASVIGRAIAFAGHTVSSDGDDLVVDADRASIEWRGDLRFYDVTRQKLFTMRSGSIDYRRQNRHEFVIESGTSFWLRTYQVNHGVYLLGDNRSDPADDSREFGEIDPAKCSGQIFMRLIPADHERIDDISHGYFDVIH